MDKDNLVKDNLVKEAFENLLKYKGRKIFAQITSTSRSGMSRRIKFFVLDTDRKTDISEYIANVVGYKYDWDKGLLVGGCGMDMIFSVLSNLNYAMAEMTTGKTINELLKTKECGDRIYDNYFIDASGYSTI
jgi:hypothetical protein